MYVEWHMYLHCIVPLRTCHHYATAIHAIECCIALQDIGPVDEIEDFISEYDWVNIAIDSVKTMGIMWPHM